MKQTLKEMIKPLYWYLKDKNQREFYRLLSKYGKMERYKPCKIKFLHFEFEVPDALSFVWQFKEIFVDEIYRFEASNNPPIIFDVGANVGLSILCFKLLYPKSKIIAYEADPMVYSYAEANIKKYSLSDITLINKAVWTDNSGIEFISEGADGGSIIGKTGKRMKIDSIRLSDEIEKFDSIDLLKMDIEGAEVNVLKDCRNSIKGIKNIFIEYHSCNNFSQRLSDILKILEQNGFRYYMQNIAKRKIPFINRGKNSIMDLQVNIWGINEEIC